MSKQTKTIKERLDNSGSTINLDHATDSLWALLQKLSRKKLENTKEYKLASELYDLLSNI